MCTVPSHFCNVHEKYMVLFEGEQGGRIPKITYMGEVNKQMAVMFPEHKPLRTTSWTIRVRKMSTKASIHSTSLKNMPVRFKNFSTCTITVHLTNSIRKHSISTKTPQHSVRAILWACHNLHACVIKMFLKNCTPVV